MTSYAGLDISQQETHVCVVDERGNVLFESHCATEPPVIAAMLREHAPDLARVAMETGVMSAWLVSELEAGGIPVVCVCARQAHAALKHGPNKTDRTDAEGLARLAQTGWLKQVHVRSLAAHEKKSLVIARARLVKTKVDLTNTVRGLLKPFGIRLGKISVAKFDRHVREQAEDRPLLLAALEPLLTIRLRLLDEIELLDKDLVAQTKHDTVCRRLMTVPGVGAIAAQTFAAVIDDPARFKKSSDLGAYLGLVPKRWQSGDVDQAGHITRCGDSMLRHLLCECANNIIAILKKPCALKIWAEQLQARIGSKKARVALARKLATLMHKLWVTEENFDWNTGMIS